MQIVRIEHPNTGNGIFSRVGDIFPCEEFSFSSEFMSKHKRFPSPYTEGLDFDHSHYCAFKSINQLQRWISKSWMKEIINFGFKVYLIDVEIFLEGKKQVCFKKEDIINKKEITNLFTI